MTNTWIKHTIEFAQEHGIEIDNMKIRLQKWHQNDRAIMDLINNTAKFTTDKLRQINFCRMHLQVINISDIVTANGTLIAAARDRERYESISSTKYKWTEQNKPGKEAQQLWQKALKTLRLHTTHPNLNHHIHHIYTDLQGIPKWKWKQEQKELWEQTDDNKWEQWTAARHRQMTYYRKPTRPRYQNNINGGVAIIQPFREGVKILATLPNNYQNRDEDEANEGRSWIHMAPLPDPDRQREIATEIEKGNGQAASDGSAHTNQTSAGYLYMQRDEAYTMEGGQKIPGRADEQTSF